MRKPVGVKWVVCGSYRLLILLGPSQTVATLSPTLFDKRFSRGASWALSFQPVPPPDYIS